MLAGKGKIVFDTLFNTLEILRSAELVYFYNTTKVEDYTTNGDSYTRITWPNHASGSSKPYTFNKIDSFSAMLQNSSYTCLLFDGSIVRISYLFKNDKLQNYNFLWWPAPFVFNFEENDTLSYIDIFELSLFEESWHKNIMMRTPIRFDFDLSHNTDTHPASHLHTQDSECRIKVAHPICLNKFFKFVFCNFYSEQYKDFDFWDDLKPINFHSHNPDTTEQPNSSLGWLATPSYQTF